MRHPAILPDHRRGGEERDLLADPDAVQDGLITWFMARARQVIGWAAAAKVITVLLRSAVVRLRHRSLARSAHYVEILAPPVAES
ncbi:hypothetical protein AB0M44_31580 [Streptosporangium subroseum]|uniref:hypothetical protein n=1 Tax=Streptosporangium subroseum TaxID=106412 RepID=UPI0034438C91